MTSEDLQQHGRADWAMLLAKWTELAKIGVALPKSGETGRWREALPSVITLQAATCALGESASLDYEERAVGRDRAEMLLREHASNLSTIWRGVPMPETLNEMLEDARRALELTAWLGDEWCVDRAHAGVFEMPALTETPSGFDGDVFAAPETTLLAPGSPALFIRPGAFDPGIDGLVRTPTPSAVGATPMRQVYRQAARDVVAPNQLAMLAGRPLLMPIVEGGTRVPRAHDAARWRDEQRGALQGGTPELVFAADYPELLDAPPDAPW